MWLLNSWIFTVPSKIKQPDYEDTWPQCKTSGSCGFVSRMRCLTRPWLWMSQETEATSNSLASQRKRPSAAPPASRCSREVLRRWRTSGKQRYSPVLIRPSLLALPEKCPLSRWMWGSCTAASTALDHTHMHTHTFPQHTWNKTFHKITLTFPAYGLL